MHERVRMGEDTLFSATTFFRWGSNLTLGVSLSISVLLSGCGGNSGPPVGAVTGTITMNGQPVPHVNIMFVPATKGSPSYGATDERGVYRLLFNQRRAGAELGKHNVLVQNREPETDDSGNRILSAVTVTIPAKYQQPGVLTADVRPGGNEVNFTLDAQ